jgi:hypothetical protein
MSVGWPNIFMSDLIGPFIRCQFNEYEMRSIKLR